MAQPRIVVDGYSLIHAMPELARLVGSDLERARDLQVASLRFAARAETVSA
jgi:predicted RNA-binding protein with PIN domain